MQRLSQSNGLRIEALKVEMGLNHDNKRAFEKLLDLALKRNVQELDIGLGTNKNLDDMFSFRLLSDSTIKILGLRGIRIVDDLSLDSVRSLHLKDVKWSLRNLLATSPQLETLELEDNVANLKKLNVANLAHLKAMQVWFSRDLEIEDIAAPALETLQTSDHYSPAWRSVQVLGLPAALSSLQTPKSLTLVLESAESINELKFSRPELEEFTLRASTYLEVTDVDAGSSFVEFCPYLAFDNYRPALRTCEIRNAAANCRWEAHCRNKGRFNLDWLVRFNNKLDTRNLHHCITEVIFKENPGYSYTTPTVPIKHLTYQHDSLFLNMNQETTLLDRFVLGMPS